MRKVPRCLSIILVLCLYQQLASCDEITIDYIDCTDTYIFSQTPSTPHGLAEFIYAAAATMDFRYPLLKFRIFEKEAGSIPNDAVIHNATLVLGIEAMRSDFLNAYPVSKQWSNNSTYNSWSPSGPKLDVHYKEPETKNIVPVGMGAIPTEGFASINVTEHVIPWANRDNNGWILVETAAPASKRSDEGVIPPAWKIYSCDAVEPSFRPRLIVNFEILPPSQAPRPNILPVPTFSPTSLLTHAPTPVDTSCRFYYDAEFASPITGPLYIYSHACAHCGFRNLSGNHSVDMDSVSISRKPVIKPRALPNFNNSVRFCFFVPRIPFGKKRIDLELQFKLKPLNVSVSHNIDYNPSFTPNIDCGKFECANGSITFPESIWIGTPVVTDSPIVVNGNLTVRSFGSITVPAGIPVEVTGCAKIKGNLTVDVSGVTAENAEYAVLLANCIEDTGEVVTLVNADRGCYGYSGKQSISRTGLSVLLTRQELCSEDEGPSILPWLIPVVFVSAVVVVVGIVLATFYVRKYVAHQEMSRIELALQQTDQ